jgi:hypothetical protein
MLLTGPLASDAAAHSGWRLQVRQGTCASEKARACLQAACVRILRTEPQVHAQRAQLCIHSQRMLRPRANPITYRASFGEEPLYGIALDNAISTLLRCSRATVAWKATLRPGRERDGPTPVPGPGLGVHDGQALASVGLRRVHGRTPRGNELVQARGSTACTSWLPHEMRGNVVYARAGHTTPCQRGGQRRAAASGALVVTRVRDVQGWYDH